MEWRPTVEERPNWSICCADRFSQVAGVTRVQLAEHPDEIAVLTKADAEGLGMVDVIDAVRLIAITQGRVT